MASMDAWCPPAGAGEAASGIVDVEGYGGWPYLAWAMTGGGEAAPAAGGAGPPPNRASSAATRSSEGLLRPSVADPPRSAGPFGPPGALGVPAVPPVVRVGGSADSP